MASACHCFAPRLRLRGLCVPKTLSVLIGGGNHLRRRTMIVLLCFVLAVLVSPFKSKNRTIRKCSAMSTYGTKRTFQPHPAIVRFWGKRSILEPDFQDFMAG